MKSEQAKPKIIMLLLEFHPIFTGHGIYLQQLNKKLIEQGCDVSILTADFHEFMSRDLIDGVDVFRFNFSHQEKNWESKLAWRVIKFLFLNRNKYDILLIHGHLDIYGFLTLFNLFMRKHTISQMVLLGADDPMTILKTYRFMGLRYKILSLMDRFLCISKPLAESYHRANLPKRKLTYIPQGVDVDRFVPAYSVDHKSKLKEKLGLVDCDQIIIFVGAIVERKGVDWLIDAWSQVQKIHPHAFLLLVGQDSFDENDINRDLLNRFVDDIKKKIADGQLNVRFVGKQNNVQEYLQCSDIFVLPSRKEGFGNVILEGMACGLPVVVTYMDGVALETVEPGKNGFIVKDVSELAEALSGLLEDRQSSVSMGQIGRKLAVENFSLDAIATRYVDVYQEILGKRLS